MRKFRFAAGVLLGTAVCISSALGELYRVDQILAKHMKAMGGKSVLANLTSMMREAKVEAGGLVGSSTTWVLPPDRTRNEIHIGVLEQVTCFDGKDQWTIDANGMLTIGDEDARKEAVTQAVIDGFDYMFPDSTLKVRYLDREGEFGRSFIVLEVLPAEGVPAKLWIDEQTWLLAKSEVSAGGLTTVKEYADYSAVNGLMVPHRIRMTIPEMQQEFNFDIHTVKVNEYVDERLFVLHQPPAHDYIIADGDHTPPIPFDFVYDHIYLRGRINGEGPFTFLLDSGAGVSVIDASLAQRLGLTPAGEFKATGIGGYAGMALVQVDSINLDGMGLYGQVIVAMEPSEMISRYTGRRIDLILGYDCLSRFATEIRFSDHTVIFHEPANFAAPAGYSFLSCSYSSRVPVTDVWLEDVKGRLILDTGSGSSVDLSEPFVRQHGLKKGRDRLFESELHGVGGPARIVVGRMRHISLGPYLMDNAVVGFAENAHSGVLASSEFDGIVGTEVLRRFDLIFDYTGGRVALKPNDAFEEEFRTGKSGLKLQLGEGGRIIVAGAVPGSPAEYLHIEPGSELVEIAGHKARDIGLGGIRDILRGEDGTEVEIKLLFENKARVETLTLRTYY